MFCLIFHAYNFCDLNGFSIYAKFSYMLIFLNAELLEYFNEIKEKTFYYSYILAQVLYTA